MFSSSRVNLRVPGIGKIQGFCIAGGAFYNPSNPGANQFPTSFTGDYFFADYVNGWVNVIDLPTGAVTRFATGVSDGCEAQTSCPAGIQGPAHGFPAGDTAITIEAWVRPGGAGWANLLHYSSSQGGQRSFSLFVRSPAGAPTVADFLWYGTPVSFGPVTSAPVFGDGWHFVAVTYANPHATFFVADIARLPVAEASQLSQRR